MGVVVKKDYVGMILFQESTDYECYYLCQERRGEVRKTLLLDRYKRGINLPYESHVSGRKGDRDLNRDNSFTVPTTTTSDVTRSGKSWSRTR